ncbi:hypothetical protein [Nocardia thailandica]|uniref:Uncharacterized protein n=1 Tax=Nocardia thailandica TaxID=257275 RepID=A0ABW6PVT2_9NOCA
MRREVFPTREPGTIPCLVIGCLRPRVWRVIVGVGVGHLDGGVEQDWPEEDLPWDFRRQNAEFFVR